MGLNVRFYWNGSSEAQVPGGQRAARGARALGFSFFQRNFSIPEYANGALLQTEVIRAGEHVRGSR